MFDRENLPGFVLLGLCGVVAIALLIEITTGVSFRFEGPGWLGNGLGIVYLGLVIGTIVMARKIGRIGKVGGGRRWPWRRRDDDQA